jgi:hypothetical protein
MSPEQEISMHQIRLPLIPAHLLRHYQVEDVNDTRFRASARMLQSMWREDRGLPAGTHGQANEHDRALGNKLDLASASAGLNFITPEIAKLAHRETVYRESGAMIDEDRLWQNLLSSQPLCFNLFGAMKLDLSIATRFWSQLLPDHMTEVEAIHFEHSPGRGDDQFISDHTAFDVLIVGRNRKGQSAFIAIELKYSESMSEPPASLRRRYDEVSVASGLYKDPHSPELRASPVQQLWREHMLSQTMLDNGLYENGIFIVVYPGDNEDCSNAVAQYRSHLIDPWGHSPAFAEFSLEHCVVALREIGETTLADALFNRYLDFSRIDEAIFDGPLYQAR